MSSREIEALINRISELREETRALRDSVKSLLEVAKNIDSNISRTRADLATRMQMLSMVFVLLDYIRVTSKLEVLGSVEKNLKEKLSESRSLYAAKFREIIKDYVSAIFDFFSHFIRRSRSEFDLIRGVLAKEKVVRELYAKLNPGYLDPELIRLAVEKDTVERAKDVREIFKVLKEASEFLESASGLEREFEKLLSEHEADLPGEGVLIFPVIGVEAEFNGSKLRQVRGPARSWEEVTAFSTRAAEFAAGFIERYPVEISRETLARVKQSLLELAKDSDEKRLIEEMELVV